MARSTCMHSAAICLVSVSSSRDKWSFSLRNGGILRETFFGSTSSMSNPLSTIMLPPSSSKESIPQSLVASLSLVLPDYRSETNVIIPDGSMPTNPLAVLWCW